MISEPQVVVRMILEAVTRFSPGKGREFLMGVKGHDRLFADMSIGYVRGISSHADVDWETVVADLDRLARRDGEAVSGTANSAEREIASEWVKSDFDRALSWYVEETGRDLSIPGVAYETALMLSEVFPSQGGAVLGWLRMGKAKRADYDELIVRYGILIVPRVTVIEDEVKPLVDLIGSEDLRFRFVSEFIQAADQGVPVASRFSRETLEDLIRTSRMTDANSKVLLRRLR